LKVKSQKLKVSNELYKLSTLQTFNFQLFFPYLCNENLIPNDLSKRKRFPLLEKMRRGEGDWEMKRIRKVSSIK